MAISRNDSVQLRMDTNEHGCKPEKQPIKEWDQSTPLGDPESFSGNPFLIRVHLCPSVVNAFPAAGFRIRASLRRLLHSLRAI